MNNPENRIFSQFENNPEKMVEGLREFSRSAQMLSDQTKRLVNEYPSQWIAVYCGEVTAKADDLETLIEEIEKQGIPLGDAIVRYIEKNQRTLIL